jgi:DNA-directed RNA polymerase specialized sigma24 family protein
MSELVTPKPRKKNYVNNRDFFNALVAYSELLKKEPEKNHRIPNYVGECISQIANKYSTKPSFSGYSFRDEMISDGIENCFRYLDKFNPERGENPFAYFTTVIHNAFIRRIKEEKKQQAIKIKNMRRHISEEELLTNSAIRYTGDTNDIISAFVENVDKNNLTKPKISAKLVENVGLEQFIEKFDPELDALSDLPEFTERND